MVDLQFEMNRLCDGDVHREIISIPLSEFKFSVSFLQDLIETKFNIPLICQVGLSMSGIVLDSLPPESDLFSSRVWERGERIVLYLRYYTNSAMVRPLHKMLIHFDQALNNITNYRVLYVVLHALNHDHMNEQGWESNEAIGTRLYLANHGFLSQLFNCISKLNQQLLGVYEQYNSFIAQQITDNSAKLKLLGSADSITQALEAALALLWNFGANSTDRILLFRMGYLSLCQTSTQIAYQLTICPYKEFNGNGKALFGKCLGVIQGFSELRSPAIAIGRDARFMQVIKELITNPADYNREQVEPVLQILIFFSCSSQNEISKFICENNFYGNLLFYFSRREIARDYSNINFEVSYIACLLMLNWLKTPLLMHWQNTDTVQDILILFTKFSNKVKIEDIVKFEEDTLFIWGSLDPFLSYFFIPKSSFVGEILFNSSAFSADYQELCQRYLQLSLFALDVLLSREANRQQLIQEHLTHLVIANWFLPTCGIHLRIKHRYPEMRCLPVPSLYDIAAMHAVCQGFRDFTEVIHPYL